MDIKELKRKYDSLLKDEQFDKLELGLKNPNIFEILRISKNELKHSNFLSWLLDPNESHKLGDIFLKRFLREVFSSDLFSGIEQVDVEAMDLSKVEVFREWMNIDILIKLPNTVVCIESKVLSKEHSNQLSRYKKTIETQFPDLNKTFIYLTPEGDSPNEEEHYHPISYEFIVDSLDRIISVYGESLNTQVKQYIKDYITIIKRELMGSDQLTELSRKIYTNHRELFDFINDHKPDILDSLKDILHQEAKKRSWIMGSETRTYFRFLTKPLKDLIYYNKETTNGWKQREGFLLEIVLYPPTNKLNFKTVISPCDENYDVKRLEEILKEIEGSKKSSGKKWLVNFDKKQRFIYEEIPTMTEEEIRETVNNFFDLITPIIKKIEDKFLEKKDELLKMKSV